VSNLAHRALLLLVGVAALALGGCGAGAAAPQNQEALRLQREDLVAVARALSAAAPGVQGEVTATKAAWPLVANGLPRNTSTIARAPIRTATASAAGLKTPALFSEHTIGTITGPGSQLAGAFRGFVLLSTRGWQLIGAAIDEIEHGSPTAARFARANVALYIESVYDAHYSLSQIGKQLLGGYEKLGGAPAFGSSLTPEEVTKLVQAYSEVSDRLYPHDGVKFGT
jgi:hypothetical protein